MTTINLSELFPSRFRGVPLLLEETDVKTSNYTLEFTDSGKVVPFDSSTVITATVPDNNTVDFPIGTVINLYNLGTEVVELQAAAGVVIVNSGLLGPLNEVSLRKRDTNEWIVAGVLI